MSNPEEDRLWIQYIDEDGVIHRFRRITDNQLRFIERMEQQLGYLPKNHQNMPLFKANRYIVTLKRRLENRQKEPPSLF